MVSGLACKQDKEVGEQLVGHRLGIDPEQSGGDRCAYPCDARIPGDIERALDGCRNPGAEGGARIRSWCSHAVADPMPPSGRVAIITIVSSAGGGRTLEEPGRSKPRLGLFLIRPARPSFR